MKFEKQLTRLAWGFVLASIVGSVVAHAERLYTAPGKGQLISRDTSSTAIPAAYATAGSQLATALSGKSRIAGVSTISSKLYCSTAGVASNCSDAVDSFAIAPNGSFALDFIYINSVLCCRAPGGAVSSGVLDLQVW